MHKELINPPGLAKPVGYSHAVSISGGRLLLMGGQTGTDETGQIVAPGDLVAQFDKTLENIVTLLKHCGGGPENVARLRIFCRDNDQYRNNLKELGQVWRKHFGKYYPAMMLIECTGFWDPVCLLEIETEAVLPE